MLVVDGHEHPSPHVEIAAWLDRGIWTSQGVADEVMIPLGRTGLAGSFVRFANGWTLDVIVTDHDPLTKRVFFQGSGAPKPPVKKG